MDEESKAATVKEELRSMAGGLLAANAQPCDFQGLAGRIRAQFGNTFGGATVEKMARGERPDDDEWLDLVAAMVRAPLDARIKGLYAETARAYVGNAGRTDKMGVIAAAAGAGALTGYYAVPAVKRMVERYRLRDTE